MNYSNIQYSHINIRYLNKKIKIQDAKNAKSAQIDRNKAAHQIQIGAENEARVDIKVNVNVNVKCKCKSKCQMRECRPTNAAFVQADRLEGSETVYIAVRQTRGQ